MKVAEHASPASDASTIDSLGCTEVRRRHQNAGTPRRPIFSVSRLEDSPEAAFESGDKRCVVGFPSKQKMSFQRIARYRARNISTL
jgi:hypothetical protein